MKPQPPHHRIGETSTSLRTCGYNLQCISPPTHSKHYTMIGIWLSMSSEPCQWWWKIKDSLGQHQARRPNWNASKKHSSCIRSFLDHCPCSLTSENWHGLKNEWVSHMSCLLFQSTTLAVHSACWNKHIFGTSSISCESSCSWCSHMMWSCHLDEWVQRWMVLALWSLLVWSVCWLHCLLIMMAMIVKT